MLLALMRRRAQHTAVSIPPQSHRTLNLIVKVAIAALTAPAAVWFALQIWKEFTASHS